MEYHENLYWREQEIIDQTTGNSYLAIIPQELKEDIKKYCVRFITNGTSLEELKYIVYNFECIIDYYRHHFNIEYIRIKDDHLLIYPEQISYTILPPSMILIYPNSSNVGFNILVRNRRSQISMIRIKSLMCEYPQMSALLLGTLIGFTLAMIASTLKMIYN